MSLHAEAIPGISLRYAVAAMGLSEQSERDLNPHGSGVGLFHTTGPMIERLARKYAPLVPVLRELIVRADTPLNDSAKARITAQLDQAARRFAAVLTPASQSLP